MKQANRAIDENDKPGILCCKFWVISCLLASFSMGTSNYMYAVNFSNEGLIAPAYLGPVTLVIMIVLKTLVIFYDKCKNGQFFTKKNSNIFLEDGSLKKMNLIPLLSNCYANTAHVFFFTMAFKYGKLAGINRGVISIIVILASVFNAVSFYFAFNEKPSCSKIIGLLCCVSTSVILAVNGFIETKGGESSNEAETNDGTSKTAYAFYSLGFAILVPIGFSLKHFMTRKYKGTYRTIDLAIDSCILEALIVCILTIIKATDTGFTVSELMLGGLVGFLQKCGYIFIAFGVAYGQGGPAQALMATNAIWMTMYTVVLSNESLAGLEILALCTGTGGAFIIAMGDSIVDRIKQTMGTALNKEEEQKGEKTEKLEK